MPDWHKLLSLLLVDGENWDWAQAQTRTTPCHNLFPSESLSLCYPSTYFSFWSAYKNKRSKVLKPIGPSREQLCPVSTRHEVTKGNFYFPALLGYQVHCRVTNSINFTDLYTWVMKGTVKLVPRPRAQHNGHFSFNQKSWIWEKMEPKFVTKFPENPDVELLPKKAGH